MIELLRSLKQDLLGRRLLPVFALAALALAGAVAYAVLGSGSSTPAPTAASIQSTLPPVPPTIAAPAPTNPKQAVSETTDGAHYQRGGATRDPFIPLPEPRKVGPTTGISSGAAKTASGSGTTAGSGAKSTGGSSGASEPGKNSGGTTTGNPSPNPVPSKPKPKPVYHVALQFGVAPPAGQNPQLTPYADLSRVTPLPSKQEELIAFAGVGPTGKGAIFTLLQPAILKGLGVCLPSPSQCESVDVPVGQTEELSFVNAAGQPIVYLLQLVSIHKGEASAHEARAHAAISYARHGAASHHRRGVARPRADLHS